MSRASSAEGTAPNLVPETTRDRNRIKKVVDEVGTEFIAFSFADIRRDLRSRDLTFLTDRTLPERVESLAPDHIREVDNVVVSMFRTHDDPDEPERPPARARRYFVLRRRLAEYWDTPPPQTDLEATYYAVWVARRLLGQEAVPTLAVTRVCRSVPDLALYRSVPPRVVLASLSNKSHGVVEELSGESDRLWRPVGKPPRDAVLERWVQSFQEVHDGGLHPMHAGRASESRVVRDLVAAGLQESKSPVWPEGRVVTIDDIRAAAGANPEAGQLMEIVRDSSRPLSAHLQYLTRPTLHGRPRRKYDVRKTKSDVTGQVYYDVPDLPGSEFRQLRVPYEDLKAQTDQRGIRALRDELYDAAHLAERYDDSRAELVAVTRRALVHRRIDDIEEGGQRLLSARGRLSSQIVDSVRTRLQRLQSIREEHASAEAIYEKANESLSQFGLSLDEVAQIDPPTIPTAGYGQWLTDEQTRSKTPSEFAHLHLRMIQTYPNPEFSSTRAEEPEARSKNLLDRVDALVAAAEDRMAATAAFLEEGAVLLGPNLRDPEVVRPLLESDERRLRMRALAALVLLGAAGAQDQAEKILHDPDASTGELTDALYALLVVGEINPEGWPKRVRSPKNRRIRRVVREVIRADQQERVLG